MDGRTLYKTPHGSESIVRAGPATLGHFVRSAADVAWRTENRIGDQAVVVLGSRAVEIAQEGREKVVGHRGTAVFYNPGAHYRRGLVDPRGDDCRYIASRRRCGRRSSGTGIPGTPATRSSAGRALRCLPR